MVELSNEFWGGPTSGEDMMDVCRLEWTAHDTIARLFDYDPPDVDCVMRLFHDSEEDVEERGEDPEFLWYSVRWETGGDR